MRKQKVMFLCTQNSARGQMAEVFLRHLASIAESKSRSAVEVQTVSAAREF